MKLVKFKDGKYGVRKWTLFGFEYKDLKGHYWWNRANQYFDGCKGSQEDAQIALNLMTDKGTEVR